MMPSLPWTRTTVERWRQKVIIYCPTLMKCKEIKGLSLTFTIIWKNYMFVGICINSMPIFFQFHLNRGWTIPWCVHSVASLFFCRAGSCSSSPWIAWRGPRGLVFSFLCFTQYILTTHTLFKHRISKNQVSGPRLKRSYLIQNILFRTEKGQGAIQKILSRFWPNSSKGFVDDQSVWQRW